METSLSRQSIALAVTTKNKSTQHYIHHKHKKTEKTALANIMNYTLIWYAFYDLQPGNGVGLILTALEPTRGLMHREKPLFNLITTAIKWSYRPSIWLISNHSYKCSY